MNGRRSQTSNEVLRRGRRAFGVMLAFLLTGALIPTALSGAGAITIPPVDPLNPNPPPKQDPPKPDPPPGGGSPPGQTTPVPPATTTPTTTTIQAMVVTTPMTTLSSTHPATSRMATAIPFMARSRMALF